LPRFSVGEADDMLAAFDCACPPPKAYTTHRIACPSPFMNHISWLNFH
jgi:hypothetical protein